MNDLLMAKRPTGWRARLTVMPPRVTLGMFLLLAGIATFTGGFWGGVGIVGSVLLIVSVSLIERTLPAPEKNITAFALVAMGVMLAESCLSTNLRVSFHDWTRLSTIFLPLLFLTSPAVQARADHPKLFLYTAFVAMAATALLGTELALNGPALKAYKGTQASLTEYNRGASYLMLLALPIIASLWCFGQKKLVLPFILILLIPASLTESRSSKLALMLALAATGGTFVSRLWMKRALMTLPVLLLPWPFVAQWAVKHHPEWLTRLPPSWAARVEIWDYVSYRILEHPWLGWGLGTSYLLDYKNPNGALYTYTVAPAAHPHNVIGLLWVELGLPGLALGLGFAWLTLCKVFDLDRRLVPFAAGCWVACLTLALVAFGFWVDSLFASFAVTGFAFALLDRRLKAKVTAL